MLPKFFKGVLGGVTDTAGKTVGGATDTAGNAGKTCLFSIQHAFLLHQLLIRHSRRSWQHPWRHHKRRHGHSERYNKGCRKDCLRVRSLKNLLFPWAPF